MDIEVGQFYKTRNGALVKVIEQVSLPAPGFHVQAQVDKGYFADTYHVYPNGKYYSGPGVTGRDLIRLVEQTVAPGLPSSPALEKRRDNPLDMQQGGNHYKDLKIQPVEYIHGNNIPYLEGNVIKYVTRWRSKNGVEDLLKAKHYIDLIIELETKQKEQA